MDQDCQDILPWTHRPVCEEQVRYFSSLICRHQTDLIASRYNSITRFNPDSRNARIRRRSVDTAGYFASRKAGSVSSSSSASVSPATPLMTLPLLSPQTAPLVLSSGGRSPYNLEWHSPMQDFSPLPGSYDGPMHSYSPSSCSSESSYHSLDPHMSPHLASLPEMGSTLLYNEPSPQSPHYYRTPSSPNAGHPYPPHSHEHVAPAYSHYPSHYSCGHPEVNGPYTPMDSGSPEIVSGLGWESDGESKHPHYKSQHGPDYPVSFTLFQGGEARSDLVLRPMFSDAHSLFPASRFSPTHILHFSRDLPALLPTICDILRVDSISQNPYPESSALLACCRVYFYLALVALLFVISSLHLYSLIYHHP